MTTSTTTANRAEQRERLIQRYGGTVLVIEDEDDYHVDGCPVLDGQDVQEDDIREVRADGFTACPACRPDAVVAKAAAAARREARASVPAPRAAESSPAPTPGPLYAPPASYGPPAGPPAWAPQPAQPATDGRPMWKKKRVILPAAVIAVIVIAASSQGGGSSSDGSSSSDPSGTTTTSSSAGGGAPAAAAPAAPAVTYAGQLKDDKLAGGSGAPGSEVMLSGWTVSASALKSSSTVFGKTLCSSVTMVNRDKVQQDYNLLSWKLQTPGGNVQDMTFTGENDLMTGGLAPGGSVTKSVCFANEGAGAGQYVLSWQPDLFSSKARGVWLNKL